MNKRKANQKASASKTKRDDPGPGILKFYLDVSPISSSVLQPLAQSSIPPTPTYKSTDLRTSLHGDVFQLRLLMLFLHRACKHYKKFYLATEMDKAQKFDDVVLFFEKKPGEWVWRFLQAKHTTNVEDNKITEANLLTSNTKAPMALAKYLKSVIDIKKLDTFKDGRLDSFVLCLNHDITDETENHLELCRQEPVDPILDFKKHLCKKYKLNPVSALSNKYKTKNPKCKNTFREELLENYRKAYQNEPDPCPEDVEDFFCKFRFMCRYPNKDLLLKYINKELGDELDLLNAQLATSRFQDEILKWFAEYNKDGGRYLVIEDGKQFTKDLQENIDTLMTAGLSKVRPEVLLNYKVNFAIFPDDLVRFLNLHQIQIMCIMTNSSLLTSIKVAQLLKSLKNYQAHDSYIFLTLEQCHVESIMTLATDSFNSRTSHHLFVIECQKKCSIDDNDDLHYRLENTLDEYKSDNLQNDEEPIIKQLIIIAEEVNFRLSPDAQIFEIHDTNSFEEFDDDSKKNILSKSIWYQDRHLQLDKLLNIQAAHQVLDISTLERLLLQEDVEVEAVRTNKFDPFDANMYIMRTLRRQTIAWTVINKNIIPKTAYLYIIGLSEQELQNQISNIDDYQMNQIVLISDPKITDSKQVFEKYKSDKCDKFVLMYIQKQLVWLDYQGNPKWIFQYVEDAPLVDEIPEEDVTNTTSLMKKINILVDDPGSGKSSFMGSLAFNLKKYNERLWVIKINLNDHAFDPNSPISRNIEYKSLHDVNFTEKETREGITFLVEMAFPKAWEKDETHFQKSFLTHALSYEEDNCSYPKVALLFDGFDEISPLYKQQTLKLLKALVHTRVQCIWVTSRLHEKESLEEELAGIAYRLNPFTEAQKKEYMRNLWNQSKIVGSDFDTTYDRIQNIVYNRLIDGIRMDFTNVPLQLKMLMDVLMRHDQNLPKNFELYNLYEDFTEAKFNIYYHEKKTAGASVGGSEIEKRDKKVMENIHGEIAFSLFFPEMASEELQKHIDENFKDLVRIGLLIPGGQIVRYVHQSFGEYFLAKYISGHMKDQRVRKKLLNVLQEDRFKVTRKFLDKIPCFVESLLVEAQELINQVTSNNDNISELINLLVDESNTNIFECLITEILSRGINIS